MFSILDLVEIVGAVWVAYFGIKFLDQVFNEVSRKIKEKYNG